MKDDLFLTLVATCTGRAQYSRCGLTLPAMPTQLLSEKLRSVRKRNQCALETVLGHNSTLVAHTKLKTSTCRNVHLVYLKFTRTLYFSSYAWLKRRRTRVKKKNQIKIFKYGFLNLVKVTGYLSLIKYSTSKTAYTKSSLSSIAERFAMWLKQSVDYLEDEKSQQ